MRFKIIERGGEYFIQKRVLFFWLTVEEEIGWNCSRAVSFKNSWDARKHIHESVATQITIEYYCGEGK